MDYLEQDQGEPEHNSEWPFDNSDTQKLEQRQREFELEILEIIEKLQRDNVRAARLNLAAVIGFGIIVVILSIMQLRLANKPPTVIINQPIEQKSFEPPGTDVPPLHTTSGMH